MQRNLQVVVKKHNVVVVSAVVILVVLVVVSIIHIVGVIEGVSTGVTVEKAEITRAASDASNVAEIAGVVVNPNAIGVHVRPVVAPQINSAISRDHGTRALIEAQVSGLEPVGINGLSIAGSASAADIAFIRYDIPSPIGNDGSIATAAIERSISSDTGSTTSGIDGAGIIASINAAPISIDGIDGRGAEAIERISAGATLDIGDDKITEIAATTIIDRSGEIGIS